MMTQTTLSPAILIVDDDADMLKLLPLLVQNVAPTYDILTAGDAQNALERLAERPIALLITDYMMPDMNGLQLTAAVKAASPTTHVIMLTAYSSAVLEQRARDERVDTFLAKDAMFDLKDVVRDILGLTTSADD
jgi:two-component system, response regulator, stage 0 sporulation protein F